jgi:hypothetical protein
MEQQALIPDILVEREERPKPNGGNGRPPGATNLRRRALERAAQSEALPIILKLIDLAKQGDTLAARIILDRIWPRPKTAPITVDLPKTGTPSEIRAAMHDLLHKIATGEIPTDDGQLLMATMRDVLDAHRIQTIDLTPSLAAPQSDARTALAERLERIIEAREQSAVSDQQSAEDARLNAES